MSEPRAPLEEVPTCEHDDFERYPDAIEDIPIYDEDDNLVGIRIRCWICNPKENES